VAIVSLADLKDVEQALQSFAGLISAAVAARQPRAARSNASAAQRASAYQELRHAIVEALMVQEKLRAFTPMYGSLVGVVWTAPHRLRLLDAYFAAIGRVLTAYNDVQADGQPGPLEAADELMTRFGEAGERLGPACRRFRAQPQQYEAARDEVVRALRAFTFAAQEDSGWSWWRRLRSWAGRWWPRRRRPARSPVPVASTDAQPEVSVQPAG
jgi:hypothetical protein